MQNLAQKFRPSTLEEIVEQGVVIDIVKNICQSDEITNRNFLFIGPAGTGKAELLTNKILTTSGFKMMKDIQIGDEVFTGKGNKGKVVGIYPQGKRPIYRITLQDRTYIDVSDEHLNVFYRYNQDKKQRQDYCMTTTELIDFFEQSRFKLRIDIPEVDWDNSDLPIDPYLLGALIGDGSLSSDNFEFSNSEEDVIEKVDSILRRDWNKMLKKVPGDNVDYSIVDVDYVRTKYTFSYEGKDYKTSELQKLFLAKGYPMFDADSLIKLSEGTGPNLVKWYPELVGKITFTINDTYKSWTDGDPLRNALRKLGLLCVSSEKHIPQEYLLTCRENRIALLQGLYDTDGYTEKGGLTLFTTTSFQLSSDFAFLVRSLGIRDTVCAHPAKYKLKGESDYIYTGNTAYEHNIKISNSLQYCTSEKHCSRRVNRQNPPMRNIISIEYLEEAECQCIMIDHDDHTYISGDGFIPTHNTTTARAIARELNNGSLSNVIELDAASHSGVDSVREIIEQMRSYPVGSKYKTFILDECFPPSARVHTPKGPVPISDIKPGDIVFNMTGVVNVRDVFKNQVNPKRLICVHLANKDIVTTRDHLFFTPFGWIEACKLEEGDKLCSFNLIDKLISSDYMSFHHYLNPKNRVVTTCEVLDFDGFSESTTYELINKPNLFKINRRGGWTDIACEIEAASKLRSDPELIVESIECYEPGTNDDFFQSFFTENHLTDEYVTMYDLEIEGHPSYFVEGILVHNCHAFSSNAWQALLKTLEDQPARTLTCMCTTNPEKIPATILSRVQTFQLSKISLDGIFNRLKYIVEEENKERANITYTDDALLYISKISAGGLRDAITALDQCLSYSSDITVENVAKALDLPNYDDYFTLLNAIAKKDNAKIVGMINTVYNSGINFVNWFDGFFSFVTNIIKYIYLQDINQTMIPSIYQDKISGYGTAHSVLCLKLSNKLVKMNQELKTTQYLQELAISYLCIVPTTKKG